MVERADARAPLPARLRGQGAVRARARRFVGEVAENVDLERVEALREAAHLADDESWRILRRLRRGRVQGVVKR